MGDQTGHQLAQVKPVVEPIAESAEVLAGVLAELEGFVCSADHGLEVAQHRVDPLELRQVARLASTDGHEGMGAARVDDAGKAAQTVAAHIATGHQMHACPVGDGLGCEARYWTELDAYGVAAWVVETAATKETLFGEPRPPTPGRSPPRWASSR